MRPRRRNLKLLRIHFPTMLLVKSNRRHARITPEQAHAGVDNDERLATPKQLATEASALISDLGGHAAQLPCGLISVSVQHETRAGNRRRIVCTQIKNRQMPRGRNFITRKICTLFRQAGAQQAMAQIENHIHRNAADDNVSRIVPNEYVLHVRAANVTRSCRE